MADISQGSQEYSMEKRQVCLIDGAGIIEYSHVKEWNWIHILPSQKLTQNGLGLKCKTWNHKTPTIRPLTWVLVMIFWIWHLKHKQQNKKNKQVGLHQTKKLLHSQGNHKQNEKTTLRMGENICKRSNWQRINLQNIQAAHAAQYQKNKQPNPKMGGRPK